MFTHHKSMFSHIARKSSFECIGMIWHKDIDISILGLHSTALPPCIPIAPRLVASDECSLLSMGHPPERSLSWKHFLTASTFAKHRDLRMYYNLFKNNGIGAQNA